VVHPFDDRAELRAALIEHAASMSHTASRAVTDAGLGDPR
jgi:hypothetical protein